MYVRGYLQGSGNGRVVTIDDMWSVTRMDEKKIYKLVK